jgi:hypothetical protein
MRRSPKGYPRGRCANIVGSHAGSYFASASPNQEEAWSGSLFSRNLFLPDYRLLSVWVEVGVKMRIGGFASK